MLCALILTEGSYIQNVRISQQWFSFLSNFHFRNTQKQHLRNQSTETFKITPQCNHSIYVKCMRARRATFKKQNKKKKSRCSFLFVYLFFTFNFIKSQFKSNSCKGGSRNPPFPVSSFEKCLHIFHVVSHDLIKLSRGSANIMAS